MKLWFFRNKYKEAAVQVLNVERLDLDSPRTETSVPLSLPEEFRVTIQNVENSTIHTRTEYISIFSHSHYLLPDIFSSLKKIVVLDDDVVVQRDLSPLWTLSMGEKVNGAMQFCSVRLGQLKTYLGEKGFDQNSCAWMSGLNVINLVKWRELGLTQSYGRLIKEVSALSLKVIRSAMLYFQKILLSLAIAFSFNSFFMMGLFLAGGRTSLSHPKILLPHTIFCPHFTFSFIILYDVSLFDISRPFLCLVIIFYRQYFR